MLPDAPETTRLQADQAPGRTALENLVVVLYQPQDLVNVALVVRAMKNMELDKLRLVAPHEFDARRIEGIAHDTGEIIERIEIVESFDDAIREAVHVAATTARRRSKRQEWSEPRDAAPRLLDRSRSGEVAIVFGREDRGLPNEVLDRCDEAICIPTNPRHPSLNLAHAALLVFYELRESARALGGLAERDLSGKARDRSPPATSEQLEHFFALWEKALDEIGMFKAGDETSKMRSFRRLFRRTEPDVRELRLLEATAWRILYYAERTLARLRKTQSVAEASTAAEADSGSAAGA